MVVGRQEGERRTNTWRDARRPTRLFLLRSHIPLHPTSVHHAAPDRSCRSQLATIDQDYCSAPHNSPFVSSRSASSSLAIQHHPSLRGSRDRTSLRSALRLWHGYKARPTSVSSKRLEVLRFALTLPHLVSPQGLRLAACCCSTWRLSQSALCSQPGRYGLERGMRA